jgi:hypothetical protein
MGASLCLTWALLRAPTKVKSCDVCACAVVQPSSRHSERSEESSFLILGLINIFAGSF